MTAPLRLRRKIPTAAGTCSSDHGQLTTDGHDIRCMTCKTVSRPGDWNARVQRFAVAARRQLEEAAV